MTQRLRLAIAQLNPVVGDVEGNLRRLRAARASAVGQGAHVLVTSELFLAGYPTEDLVRKPAFLDACRAAAEEMARETADGGPAVLLGLPWVEEGRVHNAVALLDGGRIAALRFKVDLPNYGVFDEKRVFEPGPMPGPMVIRGVRVGVPICEDIWSPDVIECLAETGAEALIVPNASPYRTGRLDERLSTVVARVTEAGLPLLYVNQMGGQDELVFDGASFALNADRTLALQLPAFAESVATLDLVAAGGGRRFEPGPVHAVEDGDTADYAACVLGLRDYVEKNRFPGVVLGLSGGIDSALCACMAVDALGPARVHTVMMPYRYTASISIEDATAIAAALGCRHDTLLIGGAVEALEAALAPLFEGRSRDLTEENLQSRVRGTLLMSLSNKFGPMVVTTGNKSEMSVGYATLYGDMNGGFNPIKDLYKMQVFRLAALRNRWRPADALGPAGVVIPERVITRPPSAELREDQKDEDSLPPYPVLDAILARLIEAEARVADVIAAGFEPETVRKVERLLALAEYKRRQAAPGVKVTRRSFGRERRYPITNRFRDGGAAPHAPDRTLAPAAARPSVETLDV